MKWPSNPAMLASHKVNNVRTACSKLCEPESQTTLHFLRGHMLAWTCLALNMRMFSMNPAVPPPPFPPHPPSTPTLGIRRGMYSDDCEMTVGVMMALVAHGTALDEAQLVAAWQQQWELARCRPLPAAPGGERAGHGSIKARVRKKRKALFARKR